MKKERGLWLPDGGTKNTGPAFLFCTTGRNNEMGKYFVRNTPLAGLEQEMMLPPNFTPRGSSSAVLCGYSPHGAGVDCQSCLDHRRQSNRTLLCLHITERLQAGTVTIVELTAETVQPWKHLGLKQRAVGIAGRTGGFHFEDQLHIARMLKMTKGEEGAVNSHWLAAVYLFSAHAGLWQKTITAVERNQIDFTSIRLGIASVREYILYRVAKGLCSDTLGASSEELADPELVSDNTLLLVLSAVLIARYGPEVMKIGVAER